MKFFFEKILLIFDIENWLWKYNFGTFWQTDAPRIFKIQRFPLSMSILGQKACILGPTIFKIRQPPPVSKSFRIHLVKTSNGGYIKKYINYLLKPNSIPAPICFEVLFRLKKSLQSAYIVIYFYLLHNLLYFQLLCFRCVFY